MRIKKIDEIIAATLTFKGKYTLLPEANEEIVRWITDNQYQLNGNHFNIYNISPKTEKSADEMITEVCFPVKRL